MPIDPVAENTIEDENDADFELEDLFKEPKNRSMETVIEHAQGLLFVDGCIKRVLFQQSEGSAEKEPMGRLIDRGLWRRTRALCCMGFRLWSVMTVWLRQISFLSLSISSSRSPMISSNV